MEMERRGNGGAPAQQRRCGLWGRHLEGAALWGYSSSAGPWEFARSREGPAMDGCGHGGCCGGQV